MTLEEMRALIEKIGDKADEKIAAEAQEALVDISNRAQFAMATGLMAGINAIANILLGMPPDTRNALVAVVMAQIVSVLERAEAAGLGRRDDSDPGPH